MSEIRDCPLEPEARTVWPEDAQPHPLEGLVKPQLPGRFIYRRPVPLQTLPQSQEGLLSKLICGG